MLEQKAVVAKWQVGQWREQIHLNPLVPMVLSGRLCLVSSTAQIVLFLGNCLAAYLVQYTTIYRFEECRLLVRRCRHAKACKVRPTIKGALHH